MGNPSPHRHRPVKSLKLKPHSYAVGNRIAYSYFVHVLKGTKPADLSIEKPTRFEFMVNLNATEELGITLPQSLLVRADEVIR